MIRQEGWEAWHLIIGTVAEGLAVPRCFKCVNFFLQVGEQNRKSTTKGQSRIAADLEKNAVGSKKITSFFCSK